MALATDFATGKISGDWYLSVSRAKEEHQRDRGQCGSTCREAS